jgi:TPR repeat protein
LLATHNHPLTKRLIQLINRANFGRYTTDRFISQIAVLLEIPAKEGDIIAIYWLGMLSWDGWGIPQNRERALSYLQTAAEGGHRTAQYNLGVAYDNGYNVEKSYYKAFLYYSQSAKQDCKDSMHCIGSLYYWGQGTAQDYTKARYWYRKSAKLGHVDAMCDLARCYQRGVGGNKNQHLAIAWFKQAIAAGSIRATTWLGLEYSSKPIEDWQQARRWLERAAELEQAHAMYFLGLWAQDGWTDAPNPADALFWFRQAAQLGHAHAALSEAQLEGEFF